jgi:hypothetical protein
MQPRESSLEAHITCPEGPRPSGVVYDNCMGQPDYLICLECETPVYVFEWREGRVVEALCPMCGNDDPAAFASEEDLEEMSRAEEADEG